MITIHKFIQIGWRSGKYEVRMPKGAQVLSAHNQRGNVSLWAIVDTKQYDDEIRVFRVYYTGEEFHGGKFVDTVVLQDGDHVLHVFEEE